MAQEKTQIPEAARKAATDDLISDEVFASELGLKSPRTPRRWFFWGRGPAAIRIGKKLIFRRSAIAKWLAAAEQEPIARRRRKAS